MEELIDLLLPAGQDRDAVVIREDEQGHTLMVNVTAQAVTCADDAMQLLAAGGAARRVACTRMNDRSSRSHSLFTLTVERQSPPDADQDTAIP